MRIARVGEVESDLTKKVMSITIFDKESMKRVEGFRIWSTKMEGAKVKKLRNHLIKIVAGQSEVEVLEQMT